MSSRANSDIHPSITLRVDLKVGVLLFQLAIEESAWLIWPHQGDGVWCLNSFTLSSAQALTELDLELEHEPITRVAVFLVGPPAFLYSIHGVLCGYW